MTRGVASAACTMGFPHLLCAAVCYCCAAATASTTTSSVFNVLKYGARGDGVSNDTAAIRAALSAAAAAGGGVVLLPSPHTFLSGTLHMQNHTIFRVAPGATLLGSQTYTDYPYEWIPGGRGADTWHRQSLIAGARCTSSRHAHNPQSASSSSNISSSNGSGCSSWSPLQNVTIDGGGVIDGQGSAWWWASDAGSPAAKQRPDMVQPALVNGLTIRDLVFRASPNWSIHPLLCTDVLAERIVIESGQFDADREYQGHNVDGFGKQHSCRLGWHTCTISGVMVPLVGFLIRTTCT
eukprot:COSAG01_NODE_6041_length_3882_cov_27.246630_1_plen_294_part_00